MLSYKLKPLFRCTSCVEDWVLLFCFVCFLFFLCFVCFCCFCFLLCVLLCYVFVVFVLSFVIMASCKHPLPRVVRDQGITTLTRHIICNPDRLNDRCNAGSAHTRPFNIFWDLFEICLINVKYLEFDVKQKPSIQMVAPLGFTRFNQTRGKNCLYKCLPLLAL